MPEFYPEYMVTVVDKYRYIPTLVESIKNDITLMSKLIELYKTDAGSTHFDTANNFASKIFDLDQILGKIITPKDAFEIIASINRAADHGAFGSMDLRAAKFGSMPNIASLAKKFAEQEHGGAEESLPKYWPNGDLGEFLKHLELTSP